MYRAIFLVSSMSCRQIVTHTSSLRDKNICIIRHLIYDIVHRVAFLPSRDCRTTDSVNSLKLLRCSSTACKIFTQAILSLFATSDIIEFAIAATAFSLSADECLHHRCHIQATNACRKLFSVAQTRAKDHRKGHSKSRPSPWLDLRYKPKTEDQLVNRPLFPSSHATAIFQGATKPGFEEGYEYEILIHIAKRYLLPDVKVNNPQYTAWLDMGIARMNDLIRYTDVITTLATDTTAFCCFIDTIEDVVPRYKIREFQEDYENRCIAREVIHLSDTEWQFAKLPENYMSLYKERIVLKIEEFRQSQLL